MNKRDFLKRILSLIPISIVGSKITPPEIVIEEQEPLSSIQTSSGCYYSPVRKKKGNMK